MDLVLDREEWEEQGGSARKRGLLRQREARKDKMQTIGKERARSVYASRVQRNAGQKRLARRWRVPRRRSRGVSVM